jgi:hypothetical protein
MPANRLPLGTALSLATKAIGREFLVRLRNLLPWALVSLAGIGTGGVLLAGARENRESLVFVFGVLTCFGGVILAALLGIFLFASLVLTWFQDVRDLRRQRDIRK